jgi:hypothetical protein
MVSVSVPLVVGTDAAIAGSTAAAVGTTAGAIGAGAAAAGGLSTGTALLGAAGVGAAGNLASGLLGSSAASGAAQTQAQAAQSAQAASQQQQGITRGDLTPFRQAGTDALASLRVALGLDPANAPTPGSGGTPAVFNITDPSGNIVVQNATQADIDLAHQFPAVAHIVQVSAAVPGTASGLTPSNPLPGGLTFNPVGGSIFTPQGGAIFNPVGGSTFAPTQAQLEATPGYQFDLAQGLRGVENSASAQGRGLSGPAIKGAIGFAEGTAQDTLQKQQAIFQQNLQNQQGIFQGNLGNQENIFQTNLGNQQGIFQQNLGNVLNPLEALTTGGQNAANQTGTLGATNIQNANLAGIGAANALAAGQVGSATAFGNAATGIGSSANNAASNFLLFNAINKSGGGGSLFG